MARAFLPLGDGGVRYARRDAGAGSVQTHYTRSVLSIHGRRGRLVFWQIMLQENWRVAFRVGGTPFPRK